MTNFELLRLFVKEISSMEEEERDILLHMMDGEITDGMVSHLNFLGNQILLFNDFNPKPIPSFIMAYLNATDKVKGVETALEDFIGDFLMKVEEYNDSV